MVEQYPHTITVTRQPVFSQDDEGDFQPSGSATSFTSEGRAEPAGSNPVIRGADGDVEQYEYVIYMPLTTEEFAHGNPVSVTFENGTERTGTLKRQHNGQFNTRLWV